MPEPKLFKVIVVGANRSGKSQLLNRYEKNNFAEIYEHTTDFNWINKEFKKNNITLQIWEISNDLLEKNRNSTALYNGVDAFIVVGNVNKGEKEFTDEIEELLTSVDAYNARAVEEDSDKKPAADVNTINSKSATNNRGSIVNTKAKVILVGTKDDDNNKPIVKEINKQYLRQKAQERNCSCAFISAKNNIGIKELFEQQVIPAFIGENKKLVKPALIKNWQLGVALVLALAVAAVLVIPGIGQAIGLGTAIGYLVANTALQLGLLAAGAGLVTFGASCTLGYGLNKLRSDRAYRTRSQENSADQTSYQFESSNIVDSGKENELDKVIWYPSIFRPLTWLRKKQFDAATIKPEYKNF